MKKFLGVCILLLFVSCICSADESRVQPATKEPLPLETRNVGKWGKAVSGLRCRIETDKQVYKVGDKISIALTWQNVSDNALSLYYNEDDIAYRLLSVRREDGSVPLNRLIMIKNSPKHQPSVEPRDTFSLKLNGILSREYLKEAWIRKHQNNSGNLILKLDGKLLGEFPILLDRPGNFYLSFNYFLPSDSFLAKKNKDVWSGDISSEEILIKVVDSK